MCWGISPENSIVPNTVEAAMQPSKEPCAVLSAAHPHELVHANDSLKALAGMSKVRCDVLHNFDLLAGQNILIM